MSLGILNTIIALVIVLLVLSLLVQSVQTLIKKLFKVKSGQLEDMLKDLYEQAIERSNVPVPPFWKRWITKLRNTFSRGRQVVAVEKSAADKFREDVLGEFKKIGRVTFFGRPILDSVSKGDLLKVMGKLELERFFPQYVGKFNDLRKQITDIRDALQLISKNEALRGAVGTNVAELRSLLAPIFNDLESIAETKVGAEVRTKALFADLLRLKELDIHKLLGLLGQAQTALTQEKQTAAGNPDLVDKLDGLSKRIDSATKLVGDLTQKFDDAVMPLRNKREQVELWFDTVSQSFDERYTRHMKTISILISIVVVILLNANFFRVYKNISNNQVQQNVLASVPAVLELADKAGNGEPAASPSPSRAPSPLQSPSPSASPTGTASASASPSASQSPSPSPSPSMDVVAETKQTLKDIDELTRTYEGFGFTPLSWQDVNTTYWSLFGKQTPVRNADGDIVNAAGKTIPPNCQGTDTTNADILSESSCTPAWRAQTDEEWRIERRSNVMTIFGWAIMTMLLSVGAPFWQDTLESLFGVKNLLRQKSATQNIETKSGTGQTRQ